MKFLIPLLLCLPMAFVSADTSQANKKSASTDLSQFRNYAMDAIDNPYCRGLFKSYLKKHTPKAFIYVPREKERTAYCKIGHQKSDNSTAKMLIDRCEKKRKKSRKNKFTAPCDIFARNHTLLKSRADFGLKSHLKDIFYVSERYGFDELKKIVEAGAEVNQKNKLGFTPLLIAIKENNLEVVKYLLSKGADLTVKNNKGFNALIIATKDNHLEIFEYLLSNGADISSTDPRNERQAIHIAARHGYLGLLDIILKKGVDINQPTTNNELPLHLAVQSLYVPTVKYLVEKGADINAIDRTGKTPLDSARKFGSKRMVNYLTKQGAKSVDSL